MVWPVGEADMKGQAGAFACWLREPKRAVLSHSNRPRVTTLSVVQGLLSGHNPEQRPRLAPVPSFWAVRRPTPPCLRGARGTTGGGFRRILLTGYHANVCEGLADTRSMSLSTAAGGRACPKVSSPQHTTWLVSAWVAQP